MIGSYLSNRTDIISADVDQIKRPYSLWTPFALWRGPSSPPELEEQRPLPEIQQISSQIWHGCQSNFNYRTWCQYLMNRVPTETDTALSMDESTVCAVIAWMRIRLQISTKYILGREHHINALLLQLFSYFEPTIIHFKWYDWHYSILLKNYKTGCISLSLNYLWLLYIVFNARPPAHLFLLTM